MQWTQLVEASFNQILDAVATVTSEARAAAIIAQDAASAALLAATLIESYERWFAAALVPNAEVHVADRVTVSQTAFQMDGGGGVSGSWGAWLQILGSTDTPTDAGKATYSLFKLIIIAVERASTFYLIQVAFGESGPAALAASTYTEFVFRSSLGLTGELPFDFQSLRQTVGTKVWIRCWAVGADTGTLDFVFGLHEYDL